MMTYLRPGMFTFGVGTMYPGMQRLAHARGHFHAICEVVYVLFSAADLLGKQCQPAVEWIICTISQFLQKRGQRCNLVHLTVQWMLNTMLLVLWWYLAYLLDAGHFSLWNDMFWENMGDSWHRWKLTVTWLDSDWLWLDSNFTWIRLGFSLTDLIFEMAPRVSVNFVSLFTSCVGLQEEPHTAYSMSFTWVSHIVASMLTGW